MYKVQDYDSVFFP